MNLYDKKIDVVVQSKKQDIFDAFWRDFSQTVRDFNDIRLIVIHPFLKVPEEVVSVATMDFGAKEINLQIGGFLHDNRDIFGFVNDDLWLLKGWLEQIVELLETNDVASCGYVETDNYEHFLWVANETENESGIIPLLYGGEYFFNRQVFKDIGLYDDRFTWSCDDMDWAWRLKINGLSSVTGKSVKIAHQRCVTIPHNSKLRNTADVQNKQRFYVKHGYNSYKKLKDEYKGHYDYFQPYQYYTTHRNWVGEKAKSRLSAH